MRPLPRVPRFFWYGLGVVAVIGVAWAARTGRLPAARGVWSAISGPPPAAESHGHDHGGHEGPAADVIELSKQAWKNLGLRAGPVTTSSYEETVSIPAIVAERPGRTSHVVAAPLTGFVDDVFAVPGQAVEPGQPLFVLRLTNEDVVQAQTEYLKTLEALDVEAKEIARLESITSGVIAEKVILERKYERQKLEGLLKAQREALLLHGMTGSQADAIANDRRLLREFLIEAPAPHDETEPGHLLQHHPELAGAEAASDSAAEGHATDGPTLVVQDVPVRKGQAVEAGTALAVLADLSLLYLEGRAFERDAPALARAAEQGWEVSAVPEQASPEPGGAGAVGGLALAYVANQVDPESRDLRFYVSLPNEIVHESAAPGGGRFLTWRYKPGQRMQVRVPVRRYERRIVVPSGAVAEDGPEAYVFVQNGRTFQRRPVHLEFRDRDSAVIANDGGLFPGEVIALNAAHQLQMALENQAGGGIDLHAGHNH